MPRDQDRVDSVRDALRGAGLDVLACALPTNVLLLTGYWPVVGTSVALASRDGTTVLLVPEDERDLAEKGWADELHAFRPGSLDDLRTAEDAVRAPLAAAARSLPARRVGYEGGGLYEPSSYAAMHLYGPELPALLGAAFPAAQLVPATGLLGQLRAVKTPREVEAVRHACGLCGDAFASAAPHVHFGRREAEVAGAFRAALAAGDPGAGDERVGGFAYCMSGPNAARAYGAYARSRQRELRAGETVLVHCNSYAGGFWTDVTRTYCPGGAGERLGRLYEAVFAARAAALDAVRPGAAASAVDRAARAVLEGRGLGEAFKHGTGHGVGFGAISHTARPRLHPKSPDVLRPGMVFNVEPAVYLEGFGGLRHCDVVTVVNGGAEVLTPFQGEEAHER